MKQFPTLTSKRLLLNQPQIADIPTLINYLGDAKIAATTASIPHPYYEKDAIYFLNRAYQGFQEETNYIFTIREKEHKNLVGGIGLHLSKGDEKAEIGYWIAVPFWNKGYATEATAALLKFGFEELHLNKIYASHLADNPSSGKVMIKNGMIQEGLLKDHFKKDGKFRTLAQYRLTAAEFKELG